MIRENSGTEMREIYKLVSRRRSLEKVRLENPDAFIVDVTSKGPEPWVRFSPFFPHGGIPVPFSPGISSESVEGLWQALKVFEKEDVDLSKLSTTSMKGIKRGGRRRGQVVGHRKGVGGAELLGYLEARQKIYVPSYRFVLRNHLEEALSALTTKAQNTTVVFLDYETNVEIENLSRPLSHAGLIIDFLSEVSSSAP